MEKVIVGPLKATRTPTLIIIDALDECKDGEPISAILSVLSCYVDLIPNVKFFITGRPEPLTRSGLRPKSLLPVTEVLNLHEVKPEAVYSDIKLFFRTRLTDISECRSDCDMMVDWPDPSDIEILSKMAAGSFIYASTVIKFITSANHLPSERLAHIISLPRSTAEGRSGIDLLYTQVLERAVEYVGVDDEEFLSRFRTVVGAILLTFNPLSAGALLNLIRVSSVFSTLHSLPSLLLVPYSIEDPIRTSHKSFPDFLTDPERCTDKRFFVEPATHHAEILLSCLNLMKKGLKRNICNLDDHAVLSQVKGLSARRKNRIGSALEYACRFWTKHLLGIPSDSSHVEEVWKAIDEFFTTRFLFWIEVLVLTGNFDVGVYAVNDVERWYASVSVVWTVHRNLFSPLFRQEFPASGQMTASVFSQNTSTRSTTLLLRCTILPSNFALPRLGFASDTAQSSHKRLRWSGGSQLNGERAPVRSRSAVPHWPSRVGVASSQWVCGLVTSPSSMQSRAAGRLLILRTPIGWELSLSR